MMSWWRRAPAVLVTLVGAAVGGGCVGLGVRQEPPDRPLVVTGDCWLAGVAGDTRGVVTADRRVVLAGEGLGIVQSRDGGRTFVRTRVGSVLHWPSLASEGTRVWVATVRQDVSGAQVVVGALGESIGLWVPVVTSPARFIDTELAVCDDGLLILLATEVFGPANTNEGVYSVRCFRSEDGGLTWTEAGSPVVGPKGVNVEDTRLAVLDHHTLLLAYEWEIREGQPSEIRMQRSNDGGFSWAPAGNLMDNQVADLEPGGFAVVGGDLWFVASSDHASPGVSYEGARIYLVRSFDRGSSWTRPEILIGETGQLSMGALVVDDAVLLPSLRSYGSVRRRSLALYRVDAVGRWRVPCVAGAIFDDGFERDVTRWSYPRPSRP
jgi:hypothetical protein